jgi:hypothetical protein
VGSIVICLPTPFEGGELVVSQEGTSHTFDFAKRARSTDISWAFLFSDCEHEVLPVRKGTRVTLAYDVYTQDSVARPPIDIQESAIYNSLKRILDDRKTKQSFDGPIWNGLLHGYPASTDKTSVYIRGLLYRLKGADRTLIAALNALNVSWRFEAIFETENEDWDSGEMTIELSRSRDFFLARDNSDEYENPLNGAIDAADVKWLAKPLKFAVESPYVAYGNKVSGS